MSELRTLAIDIGGSGLKMLVLDSSGVPLTERTRLSTPEPATPEAVMACLVEMLPNHGSFERVSIGFPGVVLYGEVRTAVNLDPSWVGVNLAEVMGKKTGQPTRVANDADIQGLAVIERTGVELVLTLGTGLGSALFIDGRLVPNLELAHHNFRKSKTYEDCLGQEALKQLGKKRWNKRLSEAIETLQNLFSYRHLYIGGGNAKRISIVLPKNATIVDNVAGLLGGIRLWDS